jgi:hypothetical protein
MEITWKNTPRITPKTAESCMGADFIQAVVLGHESNNEATT